MPLSILRLWKVSKIFTIVGMDRPGTSLTQLKYVSSVMERFKAKKLLKNIFTILVYWR
jgi:hypothetical protein